MRGIRAAILVAFLAVPAAASADTTIRSQEPDHIPIPAMVVPTGSPVQFATQDRDGYHFDGEFTLSGVFTYGFVHSDSAGDIVEHFVFTPDLASVRQLPHYQGGEVYGLGFDNQDEFLRAAVPAAALAALKAKRQGAVSGRVTVRAAGWSTSYSCETAYYGGHYMHMAEPPRMIAAKPLSDPGDC